MMTALETREVKRPVSFPFEIRGGVLNSMGIQMYSTLGKCLVEFIANAYDGDATNVTLTIPFNQIDGARKDILERARIAKAANNRVLRDQILAEVLSDEIFVDIEDDGHGMSPADIASKFLPLNRQRRLNEKDEETNLHSEGGRYVMGRKGLGKLAGFGTAERVIVTTKRSGDTYATRFVMDAAKLRGASLRSAKLPATYLDGMAADKQFTKIRLTGLRSEAVKFGEETIISTINESFWIVDVNDFAISLNAVPVRPPKVEYQYFYPSDSKKDGGFATELVLLDEYDDLPYQYVVKIRKDRHDLKAEQRGARIYCNNRLAAGPSLLLLESGMHNFHATDYMECVVIVDQLDRLNVDLINTNRTKFRDNPLVEAFVKSVTAKMKAAVAAHSTFKEKAVKKRLERDEAFRELRASIAVLSRNARRAAQELVQRLGMIEGVDSDFFRQAAPFLIRSLNSGDVVLKLMELRTDPKDIAHIVTQLARLAEIETGDALKVFRSRRDGLTALRLLVDRGEELWQKVRIENDLQDLLERAPWLIDATYTRYLKASDVPFASVVSNLARAIGIDPLSTPGDLQRPDLVFLMLDQQTFSHVVVVELKSPTIPLEIEHLAQLKRYMRKIEEYAKTHLGRSVKASGYLIGSRSPMHVKPTDATKDLDVEIERYPFESWKVVDIRQLLERAVEANAQDLEILERMDAATFAKAKRIVELPMTGATRALGKSRTG